MDMDNARIADRLAVIAANRAADTSIPARARSIRAGHYSAAAVAARAATVELGTLDAAGVRDALGCGAKIAAAVARIVERERLAMGLVALVESASVAASEAPAVAATLADYLALDAELLDVATRARIARAITALQPRARRQAVQWLAMATAAQLSISAGRDAAQYEAWCEAIAEASGADMAPALARQLDDAAVAHAHDMAIWALHNADKVGWPKTATKLTPPALRTVNGRVWGVIQGGAQ